MAVGGGGAHLYARGSPRGCLLPVSVRQILIANERPNEMITNKTRGAGEARGETVRQGGNESEGNVYRSSLNGEGGYLCAMSHGQLFRTHAHIHTSAPQHVADSRRSISAFGLPEVLSHERDLQPLELITQMSYHSLLPSSR